MSKRRKARSRHVQSTAIESRVIPASGPVSRPLLADQAVDQRRLAGVRAADDGDLDRLRRLVRFGLVLVVGYVLKQRVAEVAEALAVLGGDRDRLAEAEVEGLQRARGAGLALGFVGDEDDRLAGGAQHGGEMPVERRDAGARVDEEEADVGGPHRRLGLHPHAAGEALRRGLVEAGGVDGGEAEAAEPRVALAPVAGDARQVVDQRQPAADEPVEQRRLADIRPADDGNA